MSKKKRKKNPKKTGLALWCLTPLSTFFLIYARAEKN
jgi:hypothetical protein